MPKSALTKIGNLRSCGGFLSRLAYQRGRSRGVDIETLLKMSGLTVGAIKDKDAQVNVRDQIKFVELVAKEIGDSILGFHLAHAYDQREVGLLYYVAASAETLGDSLLRVERYSVVVNEGIILKVKKGKVPRVRFQYTGVARHTDTHQLEFWIGSLIRICRRLTNRDLMPIHVRIMHPRNEKKHEIEKLIGGNIEMGADVDEIDFPADSWDLPVVTADQYLNRLCVKCCEETLSRRETKTTPLRVRVENAVATLLPHRQMRIDVVATKLGMSSRTLARRLSSEDCSFAEILSNLRSALANRYLADQSLPISEVAWLLGYTETGAFTRAFQRWTGITPSAARVIQQRSSHRPSAALH